MERRRLLRIFILIAIALIAAIAIQLLYLAVKGGMDGGNSGFFFRNLVYFIAMILLADIVILLLLRGHTIRKEDDLSRELERQSLKNVVSQKLYEQYIGIICVDMDEDRIVYAAKSENRDCQYGKSIASGREKYSELVSAFCRNDVIPRDRERAAAVCSLDNVRRQLTERNGFSLICSARLDGEERYVELRFIRLAYQEGKNHFILALIDAEERVREETRQYEQTAVISGLAEDFDCVSYADLSRNTITDYRVSHLISESINGWDETVNYTAKMMLFANALSIPSEQEELLRKVEPSQVREYLSDHQVYYVESRINLFGKERAYQIKFVADAANRDHVIIGFHNIDDAISKQRENMIQGTVLDGLTSDFECAAYVELAENRVTCYRVSELFAKHIPGWRSVTDYAVRVRLLADAMVVDEDRERFIFQASAEQVIKGVTEEPVYYVIFRIRYDDTEKIYQAKYIRDPNQKNCVIIGIHNVDSEKRQEMERHSEEQAAKIRSDFLTQMSQDILSPLGSMRSMLRSARENIADTVLLQKSMDQADMTAEYLYGLVNDVLNMTSGRENGSEIIREPINMRSFAELCCAAIEGQTKEKGVRLVRYFDDIAHPFVLGDAAHLRQLTMNLLNNALRYTPEGGQITLRVSELIANDRSVTFKIDIADTGDGMDQGVLQHVWDVFAQPTELSDTNNTGTALGLAVCKMIADRMGATITVDSKVGEGSCVSVLLPAELDREAYTERPTDTSILNGMHILLAEDNEVSRNILSEVLRDSGAILSPVENGKAALELFRSSAIGEFDAVLTDNLMPEMNGIEATRAIRSLQRADAMTITIVGMSINISEEDMAAFRAAGVSAYIEKPVQIPMLVNTLLTCVHNRSQRLEKELARANESSVKDALTGVRNRAGYERMETQLNEEIAAGKAEPFAVLFCDVNNLKYVNDNFGHERGDELIRNACRQICNAFQHSPVFRMGGDEFAVILRGSDYENRDALLEKLEPSEKYGKVSIAVGVDVFNPENDPDLLSVYTRADAKMYERKRGMKAGRQA